ncbi:hypothetical protein LINPERHAP1_LOCUS4649, partial [Linum perenne]
GAFLRSPENADKTNYNEDSSVVKQKSIKENIQMGRSPRL